MCGLHREQYINIQGSSIGNLPLNNIHLFGINYIGSHESMYPKKVKNKIYVFIYSEF